MSKLIDFWERHIVRLHFLPGFITYPDWYRNRGEQMNVAALRGFNILGAGAESAVPALIRLYEQHNSSHLPEDASMALIAVGPEVAIRLFVRDTSSSNPMVRWGGVMALRLINIRHEVVVPALTKLLTDSDGNVQFAAARGLQQFGTNAQQAVPKLVLSLNDPSPAIRSAATNALKAIDPEAAAKAAIK